MAVAVEGVLGEGLEDAAGGGEGDLAAFAVEEALAYFAFEGLDLGGDGGLGDAQLLGGSGEALLVPDFKEGFELFEVHAELSSIYTDDTDQEQTTVDVQGIPERRNGDQKRSKRIRAKNNSKNKDKYGGLSTPPCDETARLRSR